MTVTRPGTMPPEYPAYDTEIVSPELPCGASWLANCLLELNVPVWNPWGFDTLEEWSRLGTHRYRYAAETLPWRQTLPALTVGRDFCFAARPVPRFSHCWPADLDLTNPIVFFVRDPRDALYSEWRRQVRNGGPAAAATFENFLSARYYHHSFSFAEYLVRFLTSWREVLAVRRSLIVRFEDYKASPSQTLERVIRFLGIESDDLQLSRAVLGSDFLALKRIENELEARAELRRQFNRRGMAFEFRLTYTKTMHEAVGKRFDAFCNWLGYELA